MMSTYHLPKFMLFAFLPTVISITVSTKYGDIKGFKVPYSSASGPFKSVSKFLGVPFAAPPTGRFRFKAPQPVKGWKPDVKEAKRHGNICIQNEKNLANLLRLFRVTDVSYSEDCLYLDVYSPNVSLSLPVMAYIHGGTYQMGTAITSQSDILALQGVVVVIIQYRLGAFGFLTTGDSAAPGNFGMLDQVEALKWIQNNIVNFGGNPDKVTIFGQSAGGSSVSLHLLSPLSKGLFHQVIAESGVDLSPFAIQTGSFGLRYAKELASKLSCSSNDHNVMVDCIRGKQAAEVQSAVEKVVFSSIDEILFAPVVDKNFLRDAPKNLRREGKFTKVPLMICFTSQEGSYFLGSFVNNSFHLMQSVSNGVSPALFMSFLSSFARAGKNSEETANLVRDALEFVYTPWPDKSDRYALRSKLVDLIGDYMFVAPSHEVADIHSQFAPVYMYEFAYAPKFSIVRTEPWMGVPHSENVRFDFGLSFLPQFRPFSSVADRNVSSLIMAMHANFARSGNPALSGVPWERYNSSHRAYLRVDTNPQTAAVFYPRRMAFWNDYHPKLMQVKFDSKAVSGASIVVTMEKCLQMILSFIFVIIAM